MNLPYLFLTSLLSASHPSPLAAVGEGREADRRLVRNQ